MPLLSHTECGKHVQFIQRPCSAVGHAIPDELLEDPVEVEELEEEFEEELLDDVELPVISPDDVLDALIEVPPAPPFPSSHFDAPNSNLSLWHATPKMPSHMTLRSNINLFMLPPLNLHC